MHLLRLHGKVVKEKKWMMELKNTPGALEPPHSIAMGEEVVSAGRISLKMAKFLKDNTLNVEADQVEREYQGNPMLSPD